MVSSIVPGAAGAGTLGVEPKYARGPQVVPQAPDRDASSDRVELSAASVMSARESVRSGIADIEQALSLARDAMTMLLEVQSVARGEGSQPDLDDALGGFAAKLNAALERGARLAAGGDVAVHPEPGAPPVVIGGLDLRLKASPMPGDVIAVPAAVSADDPSLEQATHRSLVRLQEGMSRLAEAMRALEAHQGFLSAAEGPWVRRDLDADGARLLALQVRQGLETSGAPAIANVEPQAVLTLFRA